MGEGARDACVVGWPVRHSRSPVIHGHWIKQYRLDAVYRREEIAPQAFADFISHLAERGYVGANITIPHKEAALAMSEPDDRAQAVGAANTLWYDKGRLLSTNTDVEGFTANLDACVPGWETRVGEALVLGAGGSARAVVFGLLERGVKCVHLANRTPERAKALAEALAEQFGSNVRPVVWDGIAETLPRVKLLVNTTALGMDGQPSLDIDVGLLPQEAVVADLVYVPLETALLAAAKARGLRTADGLGMLLHQAVRGFELWFRQRPLVTSELRALVEADLTKV